MDKTQVDAECDALMKLLDDATKAVRKGNAGEAERLLKEAMTRADRMPKKNGSVQ